MSESESKNTTVAFEQILTPEECYRAAVVYMDNADDRVSKTGEYDGIAQFYMAKAAVWSRLANVSSYGSVLLHPGQAQPAWSENWIEMTDVTETDEEDDDRP
jgi:hypothetical protein